MLDFNCIGNYVCDALRPGRMPNRGEQREYSRPRGADQIHRLQGSLPRRRSVPPAVAGGPIGELAKTFTTHRSRSRSILAAMWNDTDIPLGYLITFRCYGTWLHGDERGSTNRYHNIYNSPHIPASQIRVQHNTRRLKSGALILDANQRQSIASGGCALLTCELITCMSWCLSD